MYEETTIAAIATSPGEGGIGIIRISGIDACCIADKIFQARGGKFAESTPYLMRFGHVVRGDKTIVDEGLAVFMKAPHSYTGEDVVEIQIHGSMEALRQTLALVLENGAVPAARGEFTKRAFLNGRLDLTQAEAVMDVIEAKGAATNSPTSSRNSKSPSTTRKKTSKTSPTNRWKKASSPSRNPSLISSRDPKKDALSKTALGQPS